MFRWERCSEGFDPFLSVAVVDGNGDLRRMSTDFRHVSYGVHTGSENRKKDGGMISPESGSNAKAGFRFKLSTWMGSSQ